jgi:hypothetical protein
MVNLRMHNLCPFENTRHNTSGGNAFPLLTINSSEKWRTWQESNLQPSDS